MRLIGYFIYGDKRLWVYEFVSNNTLDHHLHGEGVPVLDRVSTRVKVALGCTKLLTYLHYDTDPCVIHCDIKTSNIFLDESYEA